MASVNAEPYNYLSKSIYERLQSSTPSPAPAQSSQAESKGIKEIVLFLTPNQAETLKESGAVVRPYPEYQSENPGLQEKLKQNKPQYQVVKQNENQKQDSELDTYYKLLNIQEINEDLANQAQTTEAPVEKTTTGPRYKYTKSRQQYKEKEYSSTYVPKKASRTKTANQNTNSEYVRFLPNYEKENLKMSPYQVVPLSPYQYVDVQVNVNTQANGEPQANGEAGANDNGQENEEALTNENPRENAYTQGEQLRGYLYPQRNEEAQENVEPEANDDAQSEDEAESDENQEEEKPSAQAQQKYERPQENGRIPVPVLTQKSLLGQKYFRIQKIASQPPTTRKQQVRPETTTPAASEPAPVEEEEDQYSRLLAPLYQHQAITDSIARQKEELLNAELEIRKKLQDIQKAPQHSDQEYAAEIKNLAANLEKQNALSEIEAISKSPSAFINQKNQQKQNKQDNKERRPTESVKQRVSVSTPVVLRVQTPSGVKVQSQYALPEEILRHIWEH